MSNKDAVSTVHGESPEEEEHLCTTHDTAVSVPEKVAAFHRAKANIMKETHASEVKVCNVYNYVRICW